MDRHVESVERIAPTLPVIDVKRLVAEHGAPCDGILTGKFRAPEAQAPATRNFLPTPKPPTSPLKTKFQVGANSWRLRAPTNGSNQLTLFVADKKPSRVKLRSKTFCRSGYG